MDYFTHKASAVAKIVISDLRDIANKISVLRESIEHHGDSIRRDYERNQEEKREQKREPITIKFTDEEIQSRKTAQSEQNSIQKSIRNATWGAVVAAVIYAGVTYCMLIAIQKQTRIQREASINTERAWVGLDEPITIDALEIVPQLKVEAHYRVKNFGHGPAFKVFPYGRFEDDPKLQPNVAKTACYGPIDFATGKIPRQPGPMGYTLFTNQERRETMGSPSDPWQGPPEPNLKHFWFVGCVAYLDQFKTVHWTRFCVEPDFMPRLINKEIPLQPCALYNDTDDSEYSSDRKK